MKIVIRKFMLLVMMTTAAAVAADSSSTLATKLAIEEEKSMLNNEEWATVTTTTTTPPEGFAASSSSSSLSASLLLSSSLSSSLSSLSSSSSSSSSSLVEVSGADGSDVFAQRKLSKSSKKVKHPEALCTLSLFADSVFMYANQCYDDIMVTVSACDDEDDTCYISERLPLSPQEQEENQEEEQCVVGGSFPAKQNIRYNPSTGDCEFLYVDLTDDPCNLYTGDTGTGSLGLKARINVKNNPDVMLIQFTNNKGLTFYNADDERFAKRSNDRYLRQEGETKPALSMMPHPFASHHRRMTPCKIVPPPFNVDVNDPPFTLNVDVVVGYDNRYVMIRNDTPYDTQYDVTKPMNVQYIGRCDGSQEDDIHERIAPGQTLTGPYLGRWCDVKFIRQVSLTRPENEGGNLDCTDFDAFNQDQFASAIEFFIYKLGDKCCVRSSAQSIECP